MNDNLKRIQINFKIDAQKNGQLNKDELKQLSPEELMELRKSVVSYLDLINSVVSKNIHH